MAGADTTHHGRPGRSDGSSAETKVRAASLRLRKHRFPRWFVRAAGWALRARPWSLGLCIPPAPRTSQRKERVLKRGGVARAARGQRGASGGPGPFLAHSGHQTQLLRAHAASARGGVRGRHTPPEPHVLRAAPSAQKQQRLKAHRGGLLPLGTWLAHTVPCEEAWLQDSAPASGLPGLARENQPHGILSPVPTPSTPRPPTLALPEDRTQDAGGRGTAVGHRPCCMQGQRPRPVRGDKAELARHQHGGGARSEYTRADVTAPVIPRGAGRACRRRRSTKPCGSPPHPPSSRSRPPRG